MINLDTAINMAQTYIDALKKEDNIEYVICDDEIFEDDGGWYIPTKLGGFPPIEENMKFGWKPNTYQ